jgi:hypothetical protein
MVPLLHIFQKFFFRQFKILPPSNVPRQCSLVLLVSSKEGKALGNEEEKRLRVGLHQERLFRVFIACDRNFGITIA